MRQEGEGAVRSSQLAVLNFGISRGREGNLTTKGAKEAQRDYRRQVTGGRLQNLFMAVQLASLSMRFWLKAKG
jgi:hypothetical protein